MADSAPRSFIYNPPPAGELAVLHADDDILVLNKPSGLLTVPGRTEDHADCLESRARQDYPGARIIHRLDMDTSGVIVLALNAHAHRHIGLQFEKRQTQKTYVAKIWGRLESETGRVDQPLICDWPNRPKQHVDHEKGKTAITDWEVIETGDTYTRVRLTPLTGRSHQLRVHMQFLGHPILGDNLYAPEHVLAASDRLCLHAQTLSFRHPNGGAPVSFSSPVPF
ncbi:MAG: RluA family pseudouridine synthase [Alphaproteobacteria bacterium]|nr:RluA family pseudouridine synthase [Alphaproteobacteria bacterium]